MRYYTRQFRALAMVVLLMLIAIRGPAVAGPLDDAEAAYGRNDYATALPLLLLLADRGNATAQYIGLVICTTMAPVLRRTTCKR
jgi:hypothetical protein